jgi:MFS family permease
MTALCAGANNFFRLFLCRIGVGVGEATLGPAAFSMLSDSFPKEKLGLAVSVYTMGIFIGSGLALIVGGHVVQVASTMDHVTLPLLGTIAPWRLTFLIVGIPGILVALWVMTLREPLRRGLLRNAQGDALKLSIGASLVEIGKRWGSFILLAVGMVFQSMTTFAFNAWTPAYFQRVHGWSPSETGNVLGVMFLIAGCLGMWIGGTLTDRWKAKGHSDAPLMVLMLSALGVGAFYVPAYLLQGQPWLTTALLYPALAFTAMPIGSAYSSAQLIFPNQVRGTMTALLMFILNLGGISLGPLIPALLTDNYFQNEMAVGQSLAITMAMTCIVQLVVFFFARPFYRKDYEALHPGGADEKILAGAH